MNGAPRRLSAGAGRSPVFERARVPRFPYANLGATMPAGASELGMRSGLGAGRRTQPPSSTSDKVPRPPSSQLPLRQLQTCVGHGSRGYARAVRRKVTKLLHVGFPFLGGWGRMRIVVLASYSLLGLFSVLKGPLACDIGATSAGFLLSKPPKSWRGPRVKLNLVHRWETIDGKP